MRDKERTRPAYGLTDAAKQRITRDLRKGDKALIAEITRATPDYVKKVLTEKRKAQSALALRIWKTANRITLDRARLKGDLGAW
ncbi:MAG: hypothetical protein KIT10_14485 [Flavobacteriales bacterium]|nr:hypothetical protein [Flavobacteriales bacterium]